VYGIMNAVLNSIALRLLQQSVTISGKVHALTHTQTDILYISKDMLFNNDNVDCKSHIRVV
jgi:hypothetical protein